MTVKPALWWKTEGVKSLLPGKEKAQEYLIIVFQYLEGRHKEDGSTLFSISHTDKGKWVKVAPGDFFSPSKKNQSEEEPSWRHGRVPFTGDFHGASGWCAW